MFKISTIDKLAHSVVENLGLRMDPSSRTQLYKVNFVPNIHKIYKMKKGILQITNETKDVFLRNSLDFSNIQSIQSFLERQTNFFDKFIYTNNVLMLSPQLKNINKKIIQKIMKMRSESDDKIKNYKLHESGEISLKKNQSSIKWDEYAHGDNNQFEKRKLIDRHKLKTHKQMHLLSKKGSESPRDIFKKENIIANAKRTFTRKKCTNKYDLSKNMLQYIQSETQINENYLKVHIKHDDFIRKNIQIKLYINVKALDNKFKTSEERKKRILYLCKRSILSLISPSKKAFVVFEKNLGNILQVYETQGYQYHFSSSSTSTDCICAVLILSYWAKFLVKNDNTTMIRTICYTLSCIPEKVIILKEVEEAVA